VVRAALALLAAFALLLSPLSADAASKRRHHRHHHPRAHCAKTKKRSKARHRRCKRKQATKHKRKRRPAPAAPTLTGKPSQPVYGAGVQKNVGVTMSDGTVLRANVHYPTDPRTGKPADGPFPVIMVYTPYGKDTTGAAAGNEGGPEAGSQAGPLPYFVKRGYIDVVAEVRGTGDSHGTFGLLDPIQGRDGAELVRWASRLPHSNGRVGMYGPSYMGIDQFMTANALGKGSPLKAIFPIVAGNDTYRDIAFMGGIPDGEFDALVVLTIFGVLEEANPLAENPTDLADLIGVESEHAPALSSYNLSQLTNIEGGGDQAYDETWWQERAPRNMLRRIVDNGIPAFMVDGWNDLYQRGAPMNYAGLQNAVAGRSVDAPMDPRRTPTGRYQLLQGPWFHLDAGIGIHIYDLELKWFDRWLKDVPTGIEDTDTPLHVYDLRAKRWVDSTHYPFREARPQTFFFGANGTLTDGAPTAATGSDGAVWSAATSPCTRQTNQWSMGAVPLVLQEAQLPPSPCDTDDRTLGSGPGALTYSTAPLARDTVLAGPIDATVYANSTRPDIELVATVEDVSPDGTSTPLTTGALLGTHRALDDSLSWFAPDGRPLQPYHPYTRAARAPVHEGELARYDIEVFPTFAQIAKGHRLRLTLTTSDTPHLLPIAEQAQRLAGGVYEIQRHAGAASFLEVPTAAPDAFRACAICR
jgi:putative CocE/NonD family hydrolase